MRIGIDISQAVYEGTGVGRYVREMVKNLVKQDQTNTYVLFGSSLRLRGKLEAIYNEVQRINPTVEKVILPLPPALLDILWNKLHIIPVTWFTGPLDIFWSSDWIQPPLGKVKGITTIHDLSFVKFPESFESQKIRLHRGQILQAVVDVQKRRLNHAVKECSHFLCDSEATKRDVETFFRVPASKLSVIYPGFSS